MKASLSFLMLFLYGWSFSQTTIIGSVRDNSGQPIPAANVIVLGTSSGTTTNFDGEFTINLNQTPPFTLQASSVGFETVTERIISNNQTVNFILKEGTSLDEVVISASRTPERIFESPVTVERMGLREIKNSSSVDFYDGLENIKGVDINTNSLTFKSVNNYRSFVDVVKPILEDDMFVVRTGKSMAIRINTQKINFKDEFNKYLEEINGVFNDIERLIRLLEKIDINKYEMMKFK